MLIDPNRTKLLFLCIVALLTASPLPPSSTDVDIIIIGAGWSGMGAAHHLHQSKSTNFLVLEATNRTGGRSEAIKFGDPSVGQVMIEVGSNWLDGVPYRGGPEHHLQPLYEEALRLKNFKLTRIPGGTENMSNYWRVYDSDGKRADTDGSIRHRAEKALDCLNRTASHGGKDVNLRDALVKCGWEPKTAAEWAVDWGFVVDDPGIVAERQSLLNTYPDETYMWWGPDDMFVVDQNPRGFAHLMDTLMKDTIPPSDPRIKLNTWVTQIDYSSSPVKVTSKDGRIFTAKQVICTLPLGVMKHDYASLFVPSLPDKQVKVLNSENALMAHLTKIFVQWKTPFWDATAARWLQADTDYGTFPEWHNMNHPLHIPGSNTLFLWLGEPQSTKWEASTDPEVTAAIMKGLRHRYPGKTIEDPTAFHITRHSLDPTRYGSYSFFGEGWTEHNFNTLIKPLKVDGEARVYFGGEHTCEDLSGFTHGAFLRGRDVAMDLLDQGGERYCDY